MISCSKKLHFDAAHRVMEHESKCRMLHGHRYVVEVTFTAEELDPLGRVIDFGVVAERLGKWLDDNWDHNTILWEKDKDLGKNIAQITDQKIFYLPYNPTAENLAYYLFTNICPNLFPDSNIKILRLRVHETPSCYADIS